MDIYQHDQALRTCSQGKALHRFGTPWALENHHLRWCTAPASMDRVDGPDGPMDGAMLMAYVREFLCPTLGAGDIVILDNRSSHTVAGVEKAIRKAGATLLYLPPYSPDFNPIEKFFSKRKALLRKAAKRSIDTLWEEIGTLLNAVSSVECSYLFASCGHVRT